jgi:hypothetical protein
MHQTCTFRHFRQADTANQQSSQPNDVIKRMKARAAWCQRESEPWGIVQLEIQKEASGDEATRNALFKQRRQSEMDSAF